MALAHRFCSPSTHPLLPESCDLAVVLPFRNAQRWLAESLLALVNASQDLRWQLIAVDDGSTDQGGHLLRRLTAHWPAQQCILLRTPGIGVAAARNLAIRTTKAPIIALLDADDAALPRRLQAPLHHLRANPQLSHVHGGWLRVCPSGQSLSTVEPWRDGAAFDLRSALTHKAVLPSAWTLRRDALLAVGGFDESLSHAEDVDLMLRLAAAGHLGQWLKEPLVRYRVHPSAASAHTSAVIDGLAAVVDRHLIDQPQPWADQIRYGTLTWGAWRAWCSGDQLLALQTLRRARLSCPLPLVQRPVHFLEHISRSCLRDGIGFDRTSFCESSFWRQARELLLQPL
ncbi:glycosyltransferase [Synechococcus sp. CB0101]|uniref:glycosyltransferase family 2 protein n=1 Tax=Synechococcus sp. CB0101 TaxID=232348 RepID=UPI000315F280